MIKTVAVLGAGTMGHGIAHAAMVAGYQTRLYDISQTQLDIAVGQVMSILKKGVDLGKMSQGDCNVTFDRLTATTSVGEAVAKADVIIEAAPERVDLKIALISAVEATAPAEAVIASNTSALSITELAAVLRDPGRMGGMHFFNPVHKMKLVEVVRALETSEETVSVMMDVAAQMGKETVLIKESPGFITSRINAMIGNEAFYMLQEGVASARDIDKALKLGLNHPMGPFELGDLVGLDTRLSILQYLHRTLGEKFRPCPLLEQHVKGGRLGRKVGKGVYDY